jgi:hypothetical protein
MLLGLDQLFDLWGSAASVTVQSKNMSHLSGIDSTRGLSFFHCEFSSIIEFRLPRNLPQVPESILQRTISCAAIKLFQGRSIVHHERPRRNQQKCRSTILSPTFSCGSYRRTAKEVRGNIVVLFIWSSFRSWYFVIFVLGTTIKEKEPLLRKKRNRFGWGGKRGSSEAGWNSDKKSFSLSKIPRILPSFEFVQQNTISIMPTVRRQSSIGHSHSKNKQPDNRSSLTFET